MAWSRRDLFKRDNEKLQVHNPYEQGAQRAGDIQPLYWQVKPLQVENYKSPSSRGDRIMDAVATIWWIATPAGRLEEWVSAIISKAIPMIQKAWPKVAARFANLLTKAKGNPEALTKIAKKFWSIESEYAKTIPDLIDTEWANRWKPEWYVKKQMWKDIPGMMLRPSQLQKSDPNYLNNINEMSSFKSKQIPEKQFTAKEKINNRLGNKTSYELREMNKKVAGSTQAPVPKAKSDEGALDYIKIQDKKIGNSLESKWWNDELLEWISWDDLKFIDRKSMSPKDYAKRRLENFSNLESERSPFQRKVKKIDRPTTPDMEDLVYDSLYMPTKREKLAADLDPNILASNEERYAERVEDQLSPNELNALREAQYRGTELEWTDKVAGPLPKKIKDIINNIYKRFPDYNPNF